MSTELIQASVDQDLKSEALAILSEVGLDMPTAIRMFLKAVVRERKIPFSLAMDQELERRKGAIGATEFLLSNREAGERLQRLLSEEGYTAYMSGPRSEKCRVWITDYLPPATRDSDGFFIENDALAARIRRELRTEPYNRQDDSVFPLLVDEWQRGSNEDVIGFIPGKAEKPGYQAGCMYLPSKVFWYSNLQFCVQKIIPDFDIYGLGYIVSWQQWRAIKEIADCHGTYASGVAAEIEDWLRRESGFDDPAMSIMCI